MNVQDRIQVLPSALSVRDPTGIVRGREPLLLFLGTFLLGLPLLDTPLRHDELYHVLAARGLLESGEPRIGDGLYTRGLFYTHLVAWSFRLFGESAWAARLPALLAGAALPPLLYLWIAARGGVLGARLAALLLATSPFLLQILAYARFYSWQVLAFLLAVLWLDRARTISWPTGALPAGAALLALLLALHLQPVTLFGIAGIAVWGLLAFGLPRWRRAPRIHRWTMGVVVLAALAILAFSTDLPERLWLRYRTTEAFNERFRDAFWFYHAWYQLYYPALWSLTPLFALFAWLHAPTLALPALAVFATAFPLASFAAAKGLRYLAFAQPFLFALWGLGLAGLAERMAPLLRTLPPRLELAGRGLPLRPMLVLAVTLVLFLQPFWVRDLALLAGVRLPFEARDPDWAAAAPLLRPLAERAAIVVGPHDVYDFYYLGRHDLTFEPSKYRELRGQPAGPWRWDPRTGRPVAADPAVLERVLRCFPSGLFVVAAVYRGRDFMFPTAAEKTLQRLARPLALPAGSGLLAYVWERPVPRATPRACEGLDDLRPPRDAPSTSPRPGAP